MTSRIKILILLVVLSPILYAGFQNSIRFSSSVEKSCGIVFKSSGSIAFKKEEPKNIGEFEVISNLDKKDKFLLKIKNFKKSVNLLDVDNSKIYVVLNRFKKIKVSDLLTKGVELRSKKHKIFIYIENNRKHIKSGRTTVSFELEAICDNSH